MRWLCLSLIVAMLGAIASLFVYKNVIQSTPPIKLIEDEGHRVTAFAELLKQNEINDLPPEFNFWGKDTRIEYYANINAEKEVFRVIYVTYPVGSPGERACSFVFNDQGRCIFWSKDRNIFWNGGLFDVTGDGEMEKLIHYLVLEPPNDSIIERFQIIRLNSNDTENLLDISYKTWPDKDVPDDTIRISVYPERDRSTIELVRSKNPEDNVLFKWSAEKQSFIIEGPKSPYWESHPIKETKFIKCPFHPDIQIGASQTCPICGYPGTSE